MTEALHVDDTMQIGRIGSLLLARFERPPAYLPAMRFKQILLEQLSARPEGLGYIVLTPPNRGAVNEEVSEETRELVTRFFRESGPKFVAIAIVVPPGGLTATVRRLALSAMLLVFPSRRTAKIFASLEEATRWIVPQMQTVSPSLTERQVLDAAGELKRLARAAG